MKLKAAVIGLGRMGAEPSVRMQGQVPDGWLPISHAEAIISLPQLQLVAICDTDSNKVNRFTAHYNIEKGYTDYKELIDKERPEFLCIATRTEGRYELIKHACEDGVKIIYVEKPLCRTMPECDAILDLTKHYNITLGYGVNRRYHALYEEAKRIIQSGELGELKEIVIEHDYTNLFWSHPHTTDLILYFAGNTDLDFVQGHCHFSSPYQSTDTFIDDDPLVDFAFFKFKNGLSAILTRAAGYNVRLACSKGILVINGNGEYIEIYTGQYYFSHREVRTISIAQSATQRVFNRLLQACETGSSGPISAMEIKTGLQMLYAVVYSSLREGKRISLTDIPADFAISGRVGNLYP
jgi:predicted dehydrogenase